MSTGGMNCLKDSWLVLSEENAEPVRVRLEKVGLSGLAFSMSRSTCCGRWLVFPLVGIHEQGFLH